MQTFLPYGDFDQSAKCLDHVRLGKQRVETLQILRACLGMTKGWISHPAVLMWTGYEAALAVYGLAICSEWTKRGFRDTVAEQLLATASDAGEICCHTPKVPSWLGMRAFHSAHRAALLAKNPDWYSQFGWREQASIQYVWPES